MNLITRSLTVAADTPVEIRRLDRAVQSLTETSRRQMQALFDNQCVSINGQPGRQPSRTLIDGDLVEVKYDPTHNYRQVKRPPSYLGFQILHEDEHLIVVVKPAAWLTVPTDKKEDNTLVHRVSDYLTKKNRGRRLLVYPPHRLDRGVSGVLLLAKSPEICAALRTQFEEHKPQREYMAIVAGHPSPREGEYRSFLATDDKLSRFSTDEEETGQLAVTHYRVAEFWIGTSLVRVQLETGRRNQIRVHFAEAGHPVLGDPRYGGATAEHAHWQFERLALHAARLAFVHPAEDRTLEFVSPVPEEFLRFGRLVNRREGR